MNKIEYEKIVVRYSDNMSFEEAISYVNDELDKKLPYPLKEISLVANDADVDVLPFYDTITRIRRVTGYLSTEERFNDGKLAELKDRIAHFDE